MATNYKNIKWGTNVPTEIIWKVNGTTNNWPGIIKWGSDVVWARAMDISTATKTGISSLAVGVIGSYVPSTVSRANGYFYGDTITITPTYQAYWTGDASSTINLATKFSLTTASAPATFYVRDLFTPTRTGTRTVTVKGDSHVTVTGSYTKTDGTAGSVSTKSTTAASGTAWQGAAVTTSYTLDQFYKVASSSGIGTTGAGTSNVSATVTSQEKKRQITVQKTTTTHAAPSAIAVTYYATNTTSASSATAIGTYSSFSGKAVSWSITALPYCSANSATGSVAAADNENGITIDVGCTRLARTINAQGDAHATVQATYINTSGGNSNISAGSTLVSKTDVWQGSSFTPTVSYANYYKKLTETNITTVASGSVAISMSATSQEKKRAINATVNTGVASITAMYKATASSATATVTASTTSSITNSSFSGAKVTWSAAAATYYTMSTTSGEIAAANNEDSVSINPSASEKKRAIDVTFNSNITGITIKYQPSNGTTVTVTPTASGAVTNSSFSGAKVTYTATAAQFWTTSNGEIDKANNTSKVTVSPTASRSPRNISVITGNNSSQVTSLSVSYGNTNGGTSTLTSFGATATNYWKGATFTYSATTASYWLPSFTGVAGNTTGDTNGQVTIGATRKPRTVTLTGVNCNFTATYTNTSGDPATVTNIAAQSLTNVWQGAQFQASVAANAYWTLTGSSGTGTTDRGETAITVSGTAARKMRTIRFQNIGSGITKYVTTYTNSSGGPATSTLTSSSANTISAWCGQALTWTATPASYAVVSPQNGNLSALDSSTEVIISPTISGATRVLTTTATRNTSLVPNTLVCLSISGSACYGTGAYTWGDTDLAVYTDASSNPHSKNTTIAQGSSYGVGIYTANQANGISWVEPGYNTEYYQVSPTTTTVAAGTTNVTKTFEVVRRPRSISIVTGTNAAQLTSVSVQYHSTGGTGQATISGLGASAIDYWTGGYFTPSATAATYWQPSLTRIGDGPGLSNGVVTAGAVRSSRSIILSGSHCLFNLGGYYDIATDQDIYTYGLSARTITNTWQGQGFTYSVYGESYWTVNSASPAVSGQINPGTNNVTISGTATKLTRKIYVEKGNFATKGISVATLSYVSGSGTATTYTTMNALTAVTATVWQGAAATLTATAKTNWTVSGTGTIAIGSSNVTKTLNAYVQHYDATNLEPSLYSESMNSDQIIRNLGYIYWGTGTATGGKYRHNITTSLSSTFTPPYYLKLGTYSPAYPTMDGDTWVWTITVSSVTYRFYQDVGSNTITGDVTNSTSSSGSIRAALKKSAEKDVSIKLYNYGTSAVSVAPNEETWIEDSAGVGALDWHGFTTIPAGSYSILLIRFLVPDDFSDIDTGTISINAGSDEYIEIWYW